MLNVLCVTPILRSRRALNLRRTVLFFCSNTQRERGECIPSTACITNNSSVSLCRLNTTTTTHTHVRASFSAEDNMTFSLEIGARVSWIQMHLLREVISTLAFLLNLTIDCLYLWLWLHTHAICRPLCLRHISSLNIVSVTYTTVPPFYLSTSLLLAASPFIALAACRVDGGAILLDGNLLVPPGVEKAVVSPGETTLALQKEWQLKQPRLQWIPSPKSISRKILR